MTAVSLTREFAGIGDWLMALAVLKLLNRQHPDVEAYVSFETPREPMPELVPQAFAASDVRYRVGVPKWPCRRTGHLVYTRRGPKPFIEDMVDVFTQRTGIKLTYEPVYPTFRRTVPPGQGYIVMASQGKRGKDRGKEWGVHNFAALAEILAADHEIVQIGGKFDAPLPAASRRYLGQPFDTVASVLTGARLFIGIEDGLTVLAGYLGVPLLTLYCGTGSPDRLTFERHTKLRERLPPNVVASTVDRCI